MARRRIFTIYDKLEDDGYFESNPANPGARDAQGRQLYKGPIAFPRMVYHPEGHFVIAVPGEAVATPFGPKFVGERRELVSKIVETQGEYDEAKAAGWLDKPGDSAAKNPERLTASELAMKALPNASGAAGSLTGSAAEAASAALLAKDREIAELKAKLDAVADL